MKTKQTFTKIKHVVLILALIVAIVGCTPKQEMKSIKSKYVKLAIDNPIKFLMKTHGDFFKGEEGALIALQDDMRVCICDESFKEHMKDAIELRVERYYEERNFKR